MVTAREAALALAPRAVAAQATGEAPAYDARPDRELRFDDEITNVATGAVALAPLDNDGCRLLHLHFFF